MYWYQRPNSTIKPTYNDGVVEFFQKQQKFDKYGTPLPQFEEVSIMKDWFRYSGVTSTEDFQAKSLQTTVDKRIVLRNYRDVKSGMSAKINGISFEVFRVYLNPYTKETEVSLTEVRS